MVAARQAMLDRCLVSVISAGPPLSETPPLLAFLAPADPHWEPPSQQRPGFPARASPSLAGAAAAQLTRAGSGPASSASSSAEAGNRSVQYDKSQSTWSYSGQTARTALPNKHCRLLEFKQSLLTVCHQPVAQSNKSILCATGCCQWLSKSSFPSFMKLGYSCQV